MIYSQNDIPTDQKLKDLGVLSLEKQLKLNKAVLLYKVINGLAPEYLNPLCSKPTNRYGSINLRVPFARIDKFKTSFSFSGSSLWNTIPKDIRMKSTLAAFKKAMKGFLSAT